MYFEEEVLIEMTKLLLAGRVIMMYVGGVTSTSKGEMGTKGTVQKKC